MERDKETLHTGDTRRIWICKKGRRRGRRDQQRYMRAEANTHNGNDQRLTIRQQNINKSCDATLSLINTVNPKNTDIVAIQEPYLDQFKNTRSTKAWKVVLPSYHRRDGEERSRALTMVNSQIKEWDQIKVDSPDVVGIKVKTEIGQVLIINLYVDIAHSEAIQKAAEATRRETSRGRRDRTHVIWLGDFNRHHPRWDELRNVHLFTTENLDRAQGLIDQVDTLGLQMVLPGDTPTLKAMNTGNYTRPDNVFASEGIVETLETCQTKEEEMPPRTDHFPIITQVATKTSKMPMRTVPNFRGTDWKEFEQVLQPKLEDIPRTEIETTHTFDGRLQVLTGALKSTIREVVPHAEITSFTKRWWTKELTELNRELRKARNRSKKRKHDLRDPIHETLRRIQNKYTQRIRDVKRDHWDKFLAEVDKSNMWKAHKYVTGELTDGSASKTMALRKRGEEGEEGYTENDEEKADLFFRTFFPDKGEYWKPADNHKYPKQRFQFKEITEDQIYRAIERLKPYKAPGKSGIPNVVLKKTAKMIVPIITPLFKATFRLKYFPQERKDSTIIVMRKPGKKDYAEPSAYRPIALLDTIGKVLSACVSEDLLASQMSTNCYQTPNLDADQEGQLRTHCITQLALSKTHGEEETK